MEATGARRTGIVLGLVAAALLALAACGEAGGEGGDTAASEGDDSEAGSDGESGLSGTLRLYTTVTQDTVDAVVERFGEEHPEVEVEVFRAPTGEFNARVAAERRDGEIQADVFWLTDPLSMRQFATDDLLRAWQPAEAGAVPPDYRAETFWGTRLLNLVIVHGSGVEPPSSWHDLTDPEYAEGVAVPDPGFAGSAFGALGYFALEPEFGMGYYRELAENGAVQVDAPGEVVAGVAEGRFDAGMTLDNAARSAIDDGSPIEMVWPEPGAIAIYSPIAVLEGTEVAEAAEAFVEHTLEPDAQRAIADTGWQPIRDDVDWPHETEPVVVPDWDEAFERQDTLLDEYRDVFGG